MIPWFFASRFGEDQEAHWDSRSFRRREPVSDNEPAEGARSRLLAVRPGNQGALQSPDYWLLQHLLQAQSNMGWGSIGRMEDGTNPGPALLQRPLPCNLIQRRGDLALHGFGDNENKIPPRAGGGQ